MNGGMSAPSRTGGASIAKRLAMVVAAVKRRLRIGAEEGRMSLVSHLAEFRKRLIVCAGTLILAMLACLSQAEWVADQMIKKAQEFQFVYISPTELVLSYLKLAFLGGIVLAFPVILYQLWRFIRPGLRKKERQAGLVILTLGLALFVGGAVFSFQIVMPIALKFLSGLNASQTISPMVSIESYISFMITTMVTFGLVFELPIVTISLTRIGLLDPKLLRKQRKYIVLAIFIVAALITPPDVTSQVLVAFPMMLLFEISLFLSDLLFRKRKKRMQEENEDEMS